MFFYSLLRIADLVSSTGRTSDAKEQNRMVRLRRARQSKAIIQCIGEAFSVTLIRTTHVFKVYMAALSHIVVLNFGKRRSDPEVASQDFTTTVRGRCVDCM